MHRSFPICLLLVSLTAVLTAQPAELSAADRSDIRQALSLHADRWDAKDLEAWADLFTDDVVTHVYPPGSDTPSWTSQSLDELLEAGRHYQANTLKGIQSRHHISGVVFLESSAHTARTRNSVLITHRSGSEDPPTISASGTYTMEWKRVDGKWRIARRDFRFD